MIFVAGVVIPLRLAFLNNEDRSTFWTYFDAFFDIYFGMDMLLNFVTAYYKNNYYNETSIETNFKKIALNYIKGWFFIDFFSIFPFNLMLQGIIK